MHISEWLIPQNIINHVQFKNSQEQCVVVVVLLFQSLGLHMDLLTVRKT